MKLRTVEKDLDGATFLGKWVARDKHGILWERFCFDGIDFEPFWHEIGGDNRWQCSCESGKGFNVESTENDLTISCRSCEKKESIYIG